MLRCEQAGARIRSARGSYIRHHHLFDALRGSDFQKKNHIWQFPHPGRYPEYRHQTGKGFTGPLQTAHINLRKDKCYDHHQP